MEVPEFVRVVAVGLGRAVLHLQSHDAAPYRDTILPACLHNMVYDTQVEEGREQYLFDLISLTGETDFYRERLSAALPATHDPRDRGQIGAVLRLFAERGDETSRTALYDAFTAAGGRDVSALGDQIVELDGVPGLLFVAQQLSTGDCDSWSLEHLVWLAKEMDGLDVVARALADASATDSRVAAFAAAARAALAPEEDSGERAAAIQQRRREEAADYERLRQRLEAGDGKAASLLWLWGSEASESELVRAATDLLRESEPWRLRAYLRLFHRRRFPLDPAPLLALARSADETTAHQALYALGLVEHPAVRSLALDLLSRGDGRGAALFVGNYEDGDYARLEQALSSWQDRDGLHGLGFNLRKVVAAHPTPAASPALMALYERGPCALCRYGAVQLLQQVASVPSWMYAECRHDADPAIRELVGE
jgi:hypothetical protein